MKNNKLIRVLIAFIPITLFIVCLISCASFSSACGSVRSDVLRLHILANSDSEADQSVKLLVRDALLEQGAELFDGTVTVDDASSRLEDEYDELIAVATDVLRKNGFNYGVDIFVTNEYFETRTYENVTLPAGHYNALKVILGEGGGHNWWCVMFPPLCLPAACDDAALDAYFNGGETNLLESNPKYEIRFKIVEIFERIKDKYN